MFKAKTGEKILTKHPLGKSGKNIDMQTYTKFKATILAALRNRELTHSELFERVDKTLKGKLSENTYWYMETVKLDLEARNLVERTASRPQRYRLV